LFAGTAPPTSRSSGREALPPGIPADKDLYQRRIEAEDRGIDALVYELYALTEEEIAIVEEGDH